jgi:hypothetical protein
MPAPACVFVINVRADSVFIHRLFASLADLKIADAAYFPLLALINAFAFVAAALFASFKSCGDFWFVAHF